MQTVADPAPAALPQLDTHTLLAALRDAASTDRLLPKAAVLDMTGLSSTELWRMLERNEFPQPRLRTPTRLGWLQSEITTWIRGLPLAPKLESPNKARGAK